MAYQKKSIEKQPLPVRKSGAPSSESSSTIPQAQNLNPGDLARDEFHLIKFMLMSSVSRIEKYKKNKPPHNACTDNPRWCLPEINCKTGANLGEKARDALKRNIEFCSPPTKIN